MEIAEIKKNMPFGVVEEEYIVKQFAYKHAFDDNYDQLLEMFKEVVLEMKNPEILSQQENEFVEVIDTIMQGDYAKDELMSYFVKNLAAKSDSLSEIIDVVNDEMRSVFVRRIISGFEDYKVRFDSAELLMILKLETNKRTDNLKECFDEELRHSISNDLSITADRVSNAKDNNLSNRSLEKKFAGYEEDLYNKIIFHIQNANHTDRITLSERYYEMLVDLRQKTRKFEKMYLDSLSIGIKPLSNGIDELLNEITSKKVEDHCVVEELPANVLM